MTENIKASVLSRHTSLAGQTALVTGGTKGIGRACVKELAALGAKLKKSCSEWQAQGLDVQGVAVDLSSTNGWQALVKEAETRFSGKLNILVNNAGTNIRASTRDITTEEFRTTMSTNVDAVFLLTKAAHPLLKASGKGSVVMIGSVAGGPVTISSGSTYAMTKAALDQLTRYLACEWAKDGIRINSVKPGYITTSLTEAVLKDPKRLMLIKALTPMRRVGNVEEVAGILL